MRYQDAVAARDRVTSGGSSVSGPPRVASPFIQPTISEDPIPYDALYGFTSGAASSSGGREAGPSSSSSSKRPPANLPASAGPLDEKVSPRTVINFCDGRLTSFAGTGSTAP